METQGQDQRGWKTSRMKDDSRTLAEPFYATNPLYVAQHKEWDWSHGIHFTGGM